MIRRLQDAGFVMAAAFPVLVACEGQPALSGIGEPIQVQGGQFLSGALPGAKVDGGASGSPVVTAVTFNNQLVIPGAAGKSFGGRTAGASAVGVRFADMGTGYWVVPIAEPDPQFPGENAFRFSANFDADAPAGNHNLLFVAIDSAGHPGAQTALPLCLQWRIPDNLHSCVPSIAPPNAVISLRWDTNFDLDLHVLTPSGVDVSPKLPLAAPPDAGGGPIDPKAARIDRDSLGGCIPDGLRQEDLVFQEPPASGAYQISVDPFAACGQASVRFELTVFRVSGTCPDCNLDVTFTRAGELLASQTTGGASPGLFVTEVAF
jgi:hypothetical protein